MATLKERLLVEFDENTVVNHILPVVQEWLEAEKNHPKEYYEKWGRRSSNDTTIDRLIEKIVIIKEREKA